MSTTATVSSSRRFCLHLCLALLGSLALTGNAWALTACVNLVASPYPVAFGGQSLNTTSLPLTVRISNVAGGLCFETAYSMVVTPSAGYTVSRNTCTTITAGQFCEVDVAVTPTAEGVAAGTLRVDYTMIYILTFHGYIDVPMSATGEKSLVTHYYHSILRRAPDAGGKVYWEGEAARVLSLGANVNETWYALAMNFYNSPEYIAFGRDNIGFTTDLYNTFFNRAPDPGGLAYWTGQLDGGLPREALLAGFMFSTEFRNFSQAIFGTTAVRPEVDTVTDFYRGLLSRLPDSLGFNYWLARFRAAQCQGGNAVYSEVQAISSQFTLGPEYTARARTTPQYVGELYNALLRRGGDLPGVLYWIEQINTGARTRENVRQAFVASPEFNARVVAIVQQPCLP